MTGFRLLSNVHDKGMFRHDAFFTSITSAIYFKQSAIFQLALDFFGRHDRIASRGHYYYIFTFGAQ